MKPLYTIHSGEYLVGSYIEENYPKWNIWVPSKDTGVDLLVTNPKNKSMVSLQVKFSKDFNPTNRIDYVRGKLKATGWWTHKRDKIKNSKADFWVFVLPSFVEHTTYFIIIRPAELFRRFAAIHGKSEKRIHSYFCITNTKRCWESRGLTNTFQEMIAFGLFKHKSRDFTPFLNAWGQIEKLLKK